MILPDYLFQIKRPIRPNHDGMMREGFLADENANLLFRLCSKSELQVPFQFKIATGTPDGRITGVAEKGLHMALDTD